MKRAKRTVGSLDDADHTEGMRISVILAKAGIQKRGHVIRRYSLDSRLRGNDGVGRRIGTQRLSSDLSGARVSIYFSRPSGLTTVMRQRPFSQLIMS